MIIIKPIKPDSEYFNIPKTRLSVMDFEKQLNKLCAYLGYNEIDEFKFRLMEHLQPTSQYPQKEELLSSLHYFLIHFSESDDPQTLVQQLASHIAFSSQHLHSYLIYLIHGINPPKDIPGLLMRLSEHMKLHAQTEQYRLFPIFSALLQLKTPIHTPESLWKAFNTLDLLTFTHDEKQDLNILFNGQSSAKEKDLAIENLIKKTKSLIDYQQILAFTKHTYQISHLKHLNDIIQQTPNFDTALLNFKSIPAFTHQLNTKLLRQIIIHTKTAEDCCRMLSILQPEEQLSYLKALQSPIKEWIISNSDLIEFLNLLTPTSRVFLIQYILPKPNLVFEGLGQLMDILQLLPPEAQKIYLPHLQPILKQYIKNGFHYGELLERIHKTYHHDLLKILPPAGLLRHGFELECTMHRLNPELRELFIRNVAPHLPTKSIQAESLIALLEEFDDDKREAILDIFQPQISNIITQGKQLCELLFCFDKNKREHIFSRFSKQDIAERLKNVYFINYALISLPKLAKEHFIKEYLPHILILVQKSEELISLMHVLPETQKISLLKHFRPRLTKLFHNEIQLKLLLNELSIDTYRQIIFLPELYSKFENMLNYVYIHLLKHHQISNIHDLHDAKKLLEIYYTLEDFIAPQTLNQNFFGSSMNEQLAAKDLLSYFKNPQISFERIYKKHELYFVKSPFKELLADPIMQKRLQKKETQHEKSHAGPKRIE